jgi:alpha-glucosidase
MRAILVTVLLLSACDAPPPPASSHVLADGTRLEVASDGSARLVDGDRTLLALAPGGPFARRYDASVSGTLGTFRFSRRNAVELAAERYVGAREEGSAVLLDYEGADGTRATVGFSTDEPGRSSRVELSVTHSAGLTAVGLSLSCDEASSFLGFGGQYDQLDHRGEAFPLFVEEQGIGRTGPADRHRTYFPMPYWLDLRGFGVLVDTPARTLVDLCAADPARATVEVEDDAPLTLLVFHGPTPLEVIEQLGAEVGRPARPPAWAFSLWIGVQGGRDAVLAEETALRDARVPFSALWAQDWTGQREIAPGRYGVLYRWLADETRYPDLPGMIDGLHARGVHFLGYANPFVPNDLDHYAEMDAAGLLLRDRAGTLTYDFPIIELFGSMPDFTRGEARGYVDRFLSRMVSDLHMDGWMADFGEWMPMDATLADGRDAALVHNLYPTLWHAASRDVMERLRPDGDWVVFTRSGWAREHAEAQIVWIGDQEATDSPTDGLPTVMPALLNLGLSGLPYVTHDVAGFSGGPSSEELWMRWAELGALTPIFRTHEGLMRTENWDWNRDADTVAHTRRMSLLHEALAGDFAALADEAEVSSAPMMRPLCLVFPEDPGSRGIDDEFLLGETLLAAPVTTLGATSREVYLPPGTWFDVWTGERHDGGATISVAAPLGSPPFFSRDADRPDLRAAAAAP